jgi:LPXTG-motif cell wall-anchored protein
VTPVPGIVETTVVDCETVTAVVSNPTGETIVVVESSVESWVGRSIEPFGSLRASGLDDWVRVEEGPYVWVQNVSVVLELENGDLVSGESEAAFYDDCRYYEEDDEPPTTIAGSGGSVPTTLVSAGAGELPATGSPLTSIAGAAGVAIAAGGMLVLASKKNLRNVR